MKKFKYINFLFILLIFSCRISAQELSWTEVAPGVWKGTIGKPENYDLLKAAGSVPNKEGLSKMTGVRFPLSQNNIAGSVADG